MGYFESIWKSIVLGTVQGLTEFLPVSSSGHLSLLQRVLGYSVEGASMTFINVMLHIGTLIPVIFLFWKEILALFKKPFKPLLMLVVATIPAGVVGLLFNDQIDALFSGPRGIAMLAICFSLTALELLVCETVVLFRKKPPQDLSWRHTVPMGLMQAVALFPGISRSGSTIVAGTVSGAKAEDVAKFSFLMSIPVILGSALVEMKDVIFPESGAVALGGAEIVGMLFGMIFAAVSGFFAVKIMLKVIKKGNYKWFTLYLVLLSASCIWLDIIL